MFSKAAFSLLCACASFGSLSAATLPYTQNFDGGTAGTPPPDFISSSSSSTSSTSAFTVVNGTLAGNLEYQNSITSTTVTPATAAIDFAGSLGGTTKQSFSLSTDFRIPSATAASSNVTLGLAALGATSDFGGVATSSYYLTDVIVASSVAADIGKIRVLEVTGSNTTFVALTPSGVTLNATDTFRLTLTGTYSGTSLGLTVRLENLSNTAAAAGQFSGTDTTPLVGTYFGIRNRVSTSGSLDARFDNFSVLAIPEPTSALLLGLGAVGLAVRRRR